MLERMNMMLEKIKPRVGEYGHSVGENSPVVRGGALGVIEYGLLLERMNLVPENVGLVLEMMYPVLENQNEIWGYY